MRINVTVHRLVIHGAARTQSNRYGTGFVSALESSLARGVGAPATTGSRVMATPMRIHAGTGAEAAGAATARAIVGALSGGNSR